MKSPNIVYILTDDLGYGDLSCYGCTKYDTTNLDSLAKEGIRFTDAHTPSAVCTPTRYGILTGRYCWRSPLKKGVLQGHSEPLIEKSRVTVASYLREQSYATACIGKWHLGLGWLHIGDEIDYSRPLNHSPVHLGFDYFYGISASLDMPPYCFIENDRVVGAPLIPRTEFDFSQKRRRGSMAPGWKDEEVNRIHTEKAIEYIENQTRNEVNQPFFLYLALTGPHTPWKADKKFADASKIGPRGDLILEMDWTVGKIIETLERLNIRENTLVIFTSDNGPHPHTPEVTTYGHKPAGELRGQKADIWDGGHRVPFIASWPGQIAEGSVSDELVCLTDLIATCADILQDDLPATVGEDSDSMLPVLRGGRSTRSSVVHHSINGMFSIRKGEWKFVRGKGSGGFGRPNPDNQIIGFPTQGLDPEDDAPGQLYRIAEDMTESENLYFSRPDIVQEMSGLLDEIIRKS